LNKDKMVHLIKLHEQAPHQKYGDTILINPDNISFIRPDDNGGSYIIFCCYGGQHSCFQALSVSESLEEILAIIKKS